MAGMNGIMEVKYCRWTVEGAMEPASWGVDWRCSAAAASPTRLGRRCCAFPFGFLEGSGGGGSGGWGGGNVVGSDGGQGDGASSVVAGVGSAALPGGKGGKRWEARRAIADCGFRIADWAAGSVVEMSSESGSSAASVPDGLSVGRRGLRRLVRPYSRGRIGWWWLVLGRIGRSLGARSRSICFFCASRRGRLGSWDASRAGRAARGGAGAG